MKLLAYSFAVFVAVLLTYLPSVRYEFVSYDDYEYVYQNPNVLGGLSRENLAWAVKSCGYASNWHPLTWVSLQADASLLPGKLSVSPSGIPDKSFAPLSSVMHAHNVVLHAANATLLFLLVVLMMRRLDSETNAALPVIALFALLWALHPLRTEVVCWVSERKELLSVFFMLLTMIAYLKGGEKGRMRTGEYVFSLFAFAFALLAKPVAVTLPAVLFAWDCAMAKKGLGRSLAVVVPFLLLSVGAGLLTLGAQDHAVVVGQVYSVGEKVALTLSAPVTYLRQTIWPAGLSAFYPTNASVSWIELCLGAALLAAIAGVCVAWFLRRRSPVLSLLAFAVAWGYVSLLPMLGIVKVGDQPHSDRYTYWVGCGLAAVAAMAVCRYAGKFEKQAVRMQAGVLGALVLATWMRMPVWKDAFSLYADAAPKSWAAQPVCVLSRYLRMRGEDGERQAEAMLRTALTQTHYREIRAEFAHLLACRARKSGFGLGDGEPAFEEARYEAESVLAANPAHALANEALAIVEMKEGKWASAARRLEVARATSDDPSRVDGELAVCRERLSAGKKESDVQR